MQAVGATKKPAAICEGAYLFAPSISLLSSQDTTPFARLCDFHVCTEDRFVSERRVELENTEGGDLGRRERWQHVFLNLASMPEDAGGQLLVKNVKHTEEGFLWQSGQD